MSSRMGEHPHTLHPALLRRLWLIQSYPAISLHNLVSLYLTPAVSRSRRPRRAMLGSWFVMVQAREFLKTECLRASGSQHP